MASMVITVKVHATLNCLISVVNNKFKCIHPIRKVVLLKISKIHNSNSNNIFTRQKLLPAEPLFHVWERGEVEKASYLGDRKFLRVNIDQESTKKVLRITQRQHSSSSSTHFYSTVFYNGPIDILRNS